MALWCVCARAHMCACVCVVLKQTTESEIILTTGLIILKQGIKKIYKGILIHVPLKYIYEIKLYQWREGSSHFVKSSDLKKKKETAYIWTFK